MEGRPLIDGIYLMCGPNWGADGTLTLNETSYEADCSPMLREACQRHGVEVHAFLAGSPPPAVLQNPAAFAASAGALAKRHGWSGINIDDESQCAPRSTLANFTTWVRGLSALQRALRPHELSLSVDAQAVWGIQDAPWTPHAPCKKAPWEFRVDPGLRTLLQKESEIDTWVSMDTYLPQPGRFVGQVQWWASMVGGAHFSAGIEGGNWENQTVVTDDSASFVAKMQAVWAAKVARLSFWMGVVNPEWRPWLIRWKTNCSLCPGEHEPLANGFSRWADFSHRGAALQGRMSRMTTR